MGLINRLRRITRGRIEAFLDAIEDPAATIPILIDELGKQVTTAANAEAKALTAVRSHQRRLDEATGRAARMLRGAELAVAAGQDDLARQAVAAQLEAEKDQVAARGNVETAETAYGEAREVRRQLAAELQRLQARKGELIARARQAKAGGAQGKAPAGPAGRAAESGRRLLDEVARMEEKIEAGETAVRAGDETAALLRDELSGRRVEDLLRDEEVQRRLDRLREQLDNE